MTKNMFKKAAAKTSMHIVNEAMEFIKAKAERIRPTITKLSEKERIYRKLEALIEEAFGEKNPNSDFYTSRDRWWEEGVFEVYGKYSTWPSHMSVTYYAPDEVYEFPRVHLYNNFPNGSAKTFAKLLVAVEREFPELIKTRSIGISWEGELFTSDRLKECLND